MAKSHDQRILHSSEESDWRTPPDCYRALDAEAFFEIDLAADRENTCHPIYFLGPGSQVAEDALAVDWMETAARVGISPVGFLNMPFSRRLARAYRTGRIQVEGVWQPHPIDLQKSKVYEVETWAEKCWRESQAGFTIYAVMPFAPQTDWYRRFVMGHNDQSEKKYVWSGHAAQQERRLPHRISFLRPDGSAADNAGVNSVIVVWTPMRGTVGPWQPHSYYWSYR